MTKEDLTIFQDLLERLVFELKRANDRLEIKDNNERIKRALY